MTHSLLPLHIVIPHPSPPSKTLQPLLLLKFRNPALKKKNPKYIHQSFAATQKKNGLIFPPRRPERPSRRSLRPPQIHPPNRLRRRNGTLHLPPAMLSISLCLTSPFPTPTLPGCRRPHLRRPAVHSRRQRLLPGRPDALHPAVPRRPGRVDARRRRSVPRPHARRRPGPRRTRPSHPGRLVCAVRKRHGGPDGGDDEEQDSVSGLRALGSGLCRSGGGGAEEGGFWLIFCGNRGYVALAVAWEGDGTVTREVETGLGGDREGNMVAFAVEGLKFLRDVVKGER